MERCDINMPITFKKGYYRFCEQANFNFQLNRVIFRGEDACRSAERGTPR